MSHHWCLVVNYYTRNGVTVKEEWELKKLSTSNQTLKVYTGSTAMRIVGTLRSRQLSTKLLEVREYYNPLFVNNSVD